MIYGEKVIEQINEKEDIDVVISDQGQLSILFSRDHTRQLDNKNMKYPTDSYYIYDTLYGTMRKSDLIHTLKEKQNIVVRHIEEVKNSMDMSKHYFYILLSVFQSSNSKQTLREVVEGLIFGFKYGITRLGIKESNGDKIPVHSYSGYNHSPMGNSTIVIGIPVEEERDFGFDLKSVMSELFDHIRGYPSIEGVLIESIFLPKTVLTNHFSKYCYSFTSAFRRRDFNKIKAEKRKYTMQDKKKLKEGIGLLLEKMTDD